MVKSDCINMTFHLEETPTITLNCTNLTQLSQLNVKDYATKYRKLDSFKSPELKQKQIRNYIDTKNNDMESRGKAMEWTESRSYQFQPNLKADLRLHSHNGFIFLINCPGF